MNKWMKLGGRAVVSTLLCGSLFFGTASAETAPAADGMEAFREAITTVSKQDRRIFRQDLLFFAPALRADLDIIGQTKGHSLRLAGKLDIVCTSNDGETADLSLPFFIDQKKKELTIYFKPDKTWRKFQAPTLAASAVDQITTPDEEDVETILSSVKNVVVLRETDAQRTMLVTLDNNRLADLIAEYSKKYPADKGTSDDGEMQNHFMSCLEQGMRRAEVWYIWTVDKTTWQTITMSYNLSPLLQETARVALETHPEWPKEVTDLVETVAFYSDLKTYATFLSPKAQKLLEIPAEAKEAPMVEDIIADDTTAKK